MLKAQYALIVGGAALVAALAFMDRSVVKNNNKTIAETTQAAESKAPGADQNQKVEEMHRVELSNDQVISLDKLKAQFRTTNDVSQKGAALDSLMAALRKVNLYDTAAFYAAEFAGLAPQQEHLMKAGDAYYDAFMLAMDDNKRKNMNEKARSFYQRVLEKSPDFLEAKTKLGMTYVVSETPMQGVLMIREVLEKDPDNELAIKSLGLLSMQSGQFDKAVERFKQLTAINPDNIEGRFYLGVSYMETKKKKEAIEQFEFVSKNTADPGLKSSADNYIQELKK